MHQKLHFLGWTRGLADRIAGWLLDSTSHPWSLRDTLVVVPTAQSGRRLRRALAERAASAGTGVLMGAVVTPFQIFSHLAADEQVVEPWAARAIWYDVLSPERIRQLNGLFPSAPRSVDPAWRRKAMDSLFGIRAQLAEAGLTPSALAQSDALPAAEKARWRDIALVESVARSRLEKSGHVDPVDFQLRAAREASPPPGIGRVVLAACPDLAPLVRQMIERWSSRVSVDVLIHAPPSMAAAFDTWGIPDKMYWKSEALLDLEADHVAIRVVDQPRDQAAAVGHALGEHPAWAEAGAFAVGVPDEAVTSFVVRHLEQLGCPTYDPSGTAYRMHPIFRFIEAWSALVEQRSHEALREWIRLADVLHFLERKLDANGPELLIELDTAQNSVIPSSIDDIVRHVRQEADGYPQLGKVLAWLVPLLEEANACHPAVMLARLAEMYADTMLTPGRPEDDCFMEVARHLVDTVTLIAAWERTLPDLGPSDWCRLLVEDASEMAYAADHRTGAMELEGWLELPWNDAPLAVVTGMNEGFVPAGRLDDLFLPDSVRDQLGLRCDATRFARDAYLLMGLQEARRAEGRLVLIAGRRSEQGDVLKPSRLFWRCPDEVLVERARRFFTAHEAAVSLPARTFAMTLRTDPPDARARARLDRTRISVTGFSAYLNCPFRYYLGHVLEMEEQDDAKEELDDLDFGNLVHGALKAFGRNPAVNARDDVDEVAGYLEGLVRQAVTHQFGPRPPVVVRLQAESAIQRLRAFAAVHVQEVVEGWRIVEAETFCTMMLDGYEVRGTIDRIDRHADGRLRVLDYKTSDKSSSTPYAMHLVSPRDQDLRPYVGVEVLPPGKKQKQLRHWANLQLPLYIAFARELHPDATGIQAGYVQLTKAVADIGISVWEELDEALVASALDCARGVIGDLKRGVFGPPLIEYNRDTFDERWWPEFLAACRLPRVGEPT